MILSACILGGALCLSALLIKQGLEKMWSNHMEDQRKVWILQEENDRYMILLLRKANEELQAKLKERDGRGNDTSST